MNKKTNIILIVFGLAVLVASIWLGAYGWHKGEVWMHVPSVYTGSIGVLGGLILMVAGAVNLGMGDK